MPPLRYNTFPHPQQPVQIQGIRKTRPRPFPPPQVLNQDSHPTAMPAPTLSAMDFSIPTYFPNYPAPPALPLRRKPRSRGMGTRFTILPVKELEIEGQSISCPALASLTLVPGDNAGLGDGGEEKHLRQTAMKLCSQIAGLKLIKGDLKKTEYRARKEFSSCRAAWDLFLHPVYRGSRLNPGFIDLEKGLCDDPNYKTYTHLRTAIRQRSRAKEMLRQKHEKLSKIRGLLRPEISMVITKRDLLADLLGVLIVLFCGVLGVLIFFGITQLGDVRDSEGV